MTSQATGDLRTTLAANIRSARDSRDLTQRALAESIDVDTMLVSKWERGAHRPSEANLTAIAVKLGYDIAWFYTDHSARRAA